MSADIIPFPERPKGNGALEIVTDYLERVHPARIMARAFLGQDEEFEDLDALPNPDHFLAWLWAQGFMIVPIVEEENEAI